MNVKFEYAVLWFTPDMTDPNTEPIPVGLLAVGPLTESWFDADAIRLMQELPSALESLIKEALRSQDDASSQRAALRFDVTEAHA